MASPFHRFSVALSVTTRYLSEPEVAAAFRDRFVGAAQQAERIAEVRRDALERLDRDAAKPWVVVTLVPDLPGHLAIDNDTFRQFEHDVRSRSFHMWSNSTFARTSVGRRRLLADGNLDHRQRAAKGAAIDLHTDGAGTYGVQLYTLPDRRLEPIQVNPDNPDQVIEDDDVVLAIMTGLQRTAQHARDWAAAGGNALVHAALVPPTARLLIGHHDRHGFALEPRGHPISATAVLIGEATAPLDDLASGGAVLVATSALLADEVAQGFGIPELGHLTRDGLLRPSSWSNARRAGMVEWARQNGVQTADEVLL